MACAGRVEHLLAQHGGALAAVIVEPVQGTSGNVIPAQGFLKRIEAAARARGILVIADEMITGFGRTGHFWGIEHSGLLPDIVLAGKGMAGGFPMSALLTKRSLSDEAPFWSAPSGSSSSYGANPLACAAASATLGVLDDEDLVRNSAIQGRFFLEKLEELRKKFPEVIEAVRGQGLMLGVDFAEELTPGFQKHLFQEALSEGVLTLAYARRLRIQPPLAINETEIQTSLMRFERALLSTVRWSEKTRKSATSTEIFSSQRAS
jgi:4-aminobutyrate aminotransferase-like enzyme